MYQILVSHFWVLVWLGALVCSVQAAPLTAIQERGRLEVAVYKNFPPFAYKHEGRTTGIDVDLAKALAQRLGVTAAIRFIGADENVSDDLRNFVWKGHYLDGRVADIMLHVPLDATFAQREDKVIFTAPYYREQLMLAADNAAIPRDAAINTLTQYKVGVELDTLADFYLLGTLNGLLRENVQHYRTVANAARALIRSEIAAVFAPSSELEAGLGQEAQTQYPLRLLTVPGYGRLHWDLGVGIRFNHTALANAINQAMASMRTDGSLERIFVRHNITYRPPSAGALAMTGN